MSVCVCVGQKSRNESSASFARLVISISSIELSLIVILDFFEMALCPQKEPTRPLTCSMEPRRSELIF